MNPLTHAVEEIYLPAVDRAALINRYRRVRQVSIDMCRPLKPEDFRQQPMEDVSPPWWNLGHTSWFFVRNVLEPFGGRTEPQDARYDGLLNSYYVSLGPRLPRTGRGSLTRPTTAEIYRYRVSVDRRVEELIDSIGADRLDGLAEAIHVGLQHEQQHQELFYTEIKFILAQNPRGVRQSYLTEPRDRTAVEPCVENRFVSFEGGLFSFGHVEPGWCWDNELPVHRYYLEPFALENRLVTNAEFLEFVDDDGYDQPLLWLSNGWACAEQNRWKEPLYWEWTEGEWWNWTLTGMWPLQLDEPVCHISFYEADAFAHWKSQTYASHRGARLPREREWEHAARQYADDGTVRPAAFLEENRLHPAPTRGGHPLTQMNGVLWQWTSSYYEPYPGFLPMPGPLAEYNGKFMDNQRVLRGGSCVTPRDHYRISYRNFWAAPTRFQFTGIRLARDEQE